MADKISSKRKLKSQDPIKPKFKPTQAESILVRLHENGQINDAEFKNGMQYAFDFMIAAMQGHFAKTHYDVIAIDGIGYSHANDNLTPTEMQIIARNRIKLAEKKVGNLAASCFYHVLGLGMTIRDYAHKISQGGYQGQKRYLSPHQAMGVLLSGLASLSDQYDVR